MIYDSLMTKERTAATSRPFWPRTTTHAAMYLATRTRQRLAGGLESIDSEYTEDARMFCGECPLAIVCAAAGAEMQQAPGTDLHPNVKPSKRKNAQATIRPLGITALGDGTSLCFGATFAAIEGSRLLVPVDVPVKADPFLTVDPLWLMDRVFFYAEEVTGRLQQGERL